MTKSYHPPGFEMILRTMFDECISRCRHIEKGPRIAATFPVDPAIFDIPDCNAAGAKIICDVIHDARIGDVGLPAPSVHHEDNRVRGLAPWQPEVGKLQRVGPIGYPDVSLWSRPI